MKKSKNFESSPAVPLHKEAKTFDELGISRAQFKRQVKSGKLRFAGYDDFGEETWMGE